MKNKDRIIDLFDNSLFKNSFSINARVIDVNSKSFTISDMSSEAVISYDCKIDFKTGDIINALIFRENAQFVLKSYKILNKVVKNPAEVKSTYNELNKNNKKLIDTLYSRQKFFQLIRNFFVSKNFLEVHSPVLVDSPGIEKHIEPFFTSYLDYSGNEKKIFMPTSPEFSLKEFLTGGLERIFEIAKVFRNYGEDSDLHKPEFFMLEWYRAYEKYEILMKDCLNLIKYIDKSFYKKGKIFYKNSNIDIKEIKKVKVKDFFKLYNIDLDNYSENEEKFITEILDVLKLTKDSFLESGLTREDLFFKFFLNYIEPELGFECPVIVYEYPAELAALSKVCENDSRYAKRFELYIGGVEIANAYEELIDPYEQEKRFKEVIKFRENNSKIKLDMPERFINALKHGMPPSSGIALGVERLFMLFEGFDTIDKTNIFLK